jgi:DtxR family manganese transport transcriptional regulator
VFSCLNSRIPSPTFPTVPIRSHSRTRADHASEVAEDYVEAIADAIDKAGVCRSMDLVAHFSVTHATVNNTIGRMQRDGLVKSEPYQPIELTTAGKRLATKSRQRHEIVEAFLRKLGVNEQTAAIDCEGMEHHVSKDTLAAMKRILDHGWPTED